MPLPTVAAGASRATVDSPIHLARSASGFRNEYNDNDSQQQLPVELPPGIDRPSVTLSDYSLGGSSTSILVPGAGTHKDRDNDIRKKLGRASVSSLDGAGASSNSSRDSLTIPGRSKPSTSSPGPVRRYSCDNDYQPQSVKSRPRREFIEAAISDNSMSVGPSPSGSVQPSNEQLLSVNAKLMQQVELLMKQNQQLMSALEEKGVLSNINTKGILDSVNKATSSKSPSGPGDERSTFERNLRDFFYDQEEGSIDLEKIKSRSMSQRTTSKASIGTNNSNVSRKTTDKGSKSPNESLNGSPVVAILDNVPVKTPVLTPECPSSDDYIAHMAAQTPSPAKSKTDGERTSVVTKDQDDSGRKSVVDENGKKSGKWFKGFMKK
ncbi:UNVERIFIED_CONTAM: hypothetical protein HDU68_012870 [Siphonaria sp. JEL0065]|nr:hypothetical protein HDU68_012870 [Siphonaria sp. JEL0065]